MAALQAVKAWWEGSPGALAPLAALVREHGEELARSAEALEAAWLAWELAEPAGPAKTHLHAQLCTHAAAQGLFLPGADTAHVQTLLETRRRAPPKLRLAAQLAPKFFSPGDSRPFNRKLELQRLQRRKKGWEKRLGAELLEAGREEHRAAAVREAKRRQGAERRVNRVANELQQQKRAIERENTSGLLGEARRPRKKRRR